MDFDFEGFVGNKGELSGFVITGRESEIATIITQPQMNLFRLRFAIFVQNNY